MNAKIERPVSVFHERDSLLDEISAQSFFPADMEIKVKQIVETFQDVAPVSVITAEITVFRVFRDLNDSETEAASRRLQVDHLVFV